MKIKACLWLSICCILGTFQAVVAQNQEPTPAPVIIIESDWPPYFFGDIPQHQSGFARELLDVCIPETGYSPEYIFYPINRMRSYIKAGQVDIVIFSYKKPREQFVTYGHESLFVAGYRPVVRSDSGIEIHSLADFDKLRLGHLAGLRYSPTFLEYVEQRQAAGTLVTTSLGDTPLRMLLRDMVDVFVDTQDTVAWRAKQSGSVDKITILDFDIKTSEYFVTVSKNSPRIKSPRTFLNSIDQCVQRLKSDGTYAEIASKYGIQ